MRNDWGFVEVTNKQKASTTYDEYVVAERPRSAGPLPKTPSRGTNCALMQRIRTSASIDGAPGASLRARYFWYWRFS
jgi:hypothetical protein